jgi:tight adherence protein B
VTGASPQALLLVTSCLALAGMAWTGMLLMRAQQRERRVQERVAVLRGTHRAPPPFQPVSLVRVAEPRRLIVRIAAIFGFDPQKPDQHPAKWWVVLAVSLAVARLTTMLLAFFLSPLATMATPVVWIVASRTAFNWSSDRLRNRLLAQFPDALTMIVRSVRVGTPVTEAVRIVGRAAEEPTAGQFRKLADELAIGVSLDDALQQMAHRSGLPEYRFFATALTLQRQTGGSLGETLEGLADVIRQRTALRQRGYALSAEARMSALVLGLLPFLAGGMIALLNPKYMAPLLFAASGRKLLGVGAVLLGLGVLIMRTMIRKSLS